MSQDIWQLYDDRSNNQKLLLTGSIGEILAEYRRHVFGDDPIPRIQEVESLGHWTFNRLSIVKHPDYTDRAKNSITGNL